ncbi:hypothetical protein L228DRAFT_242672 [Xylona heveae TC161]|uniref:Restriction of telomere capping protein 5 n=1 Tax=Xylona heveae (strain CBS 132557 / TC161) TaxID=1328760 RepID=A0A165JH72_XYLHT|nr:hypothetical protein L228DRAFT_242672 [Xylona heveae TC161]KZF26235.1 hypothetical protein L228DRAFT_242672 [Xylona heveae TC161]
MGQGQSAGHASHAASQEQLSHEIAVRFANHCFTQFEIYNFKDVFKSLADTESGVHYWKEDTLCRFLEIPDALNAGPIVHQMASYLAAFPFASMAPGILTLEGLVKVLCIMTEKHGKVLKRGKSDRNKLLYRSLAVYDRTLGEGSEKKLEAGQETEAERGAGGSNEERASESAKGNSSSQGFSIDQPVDEDEEEDDDQLTLAALETMDAVAVYETKEHVQKTYIPADNFRRLITLLLVTAPLGPQDSLSTHFSTLSDEQLESLQRTANNILWAFEVEKSPGVLYRNFKTVIPESLPFLFEGLNPLFEHLLFSKNINLRKSKTSEGEKPAEELKVTKHLEELGMNSVLPVPGEILDISILSQLSFFLGGSNVFRKLRPLYFGGDAGFSLGSFSTKVINWRAPTVLLVSGTRIEEPPKGRQRNFADSLPPKRFPNSKSAHDDSNRVVYGAYLNVPWKETTKECFGDDKTLLFQLEPVHEVFKASTLNHDYASFTRAAQLRHGINFGIPVQKAKGPGGSQVHATLGPLSLMLDDALEFAVFTHHTAGGGSFHCSQTRKYDWQDRFEIEALEVWGCGGDEEADRQRAAWAFEEREAALRRGLNLGKDVEADRALLEMAGLVGQNRSGGSV